MPAFLLNPMVLRIGVMLLILIGVSATSYFKGYQAADENRMEAELNAYNKAFEDASAQSKRDSEAAKAASEARDAMRAKNEQLTGELTALLAEKKFKDCRAGSAVVKKLNEILK